MLLSAAKSISTFILPSSPGLSGSRNRGHHEEGTADGWSWRRGAEVSSWETEMKCCQWFGSNLILKCSRLMVNWIFMSPCLSRLQPKRVFQTVKNLNLMRQRSSLAPSPLNIPGSNQTSCFTSGRSSRVGTPRCNSIYGSEKGSGIILDNRTGSIMESPDDGYWHIYASTPILDFYTWWLVMLDLIH